MELPVKALYLVTRRFTFPRGKRLGPTGRFVKKHEDPPSSLNLI
jgi:hypothetical protein